MKHYYDGDTIDRNGKTYRINIEPFYESRAPWEDDDGCGIVRKSSKSHRDGSSDKRPGERPLNSPDRNEYQFYYDWSATMQKATADGWGLCDEPLIALTVKLGRKPTKGEIIAEAVRLDFERIRGFLCDEWCYVGVIVTRIANDGDAESDSLWGIESDCDDYIADIVDDLIINIEHTMGDETIKNQIDHRFADAMACGV